jgi:transposase
LVKSEVGGSVLRAMDGEQLTTECPGCVRLARQVEQLTAQVDQLTAQVEKLTAALEESRRAGKRQAAPFRKERKSRSRKKPGRKPGEEYGQHRRRAVPDPEEINERYVAPLPERCPCCNSRHLERGEPLEQYQIEIPQQPIIRQFTIETGCCEECGQPVRGRHGLQTSDATGAAGVQLGPRAHASITWLNKRLGLSHGKIRQLFAELFGVQISRSTSARSCHRTARRCEAALEQVKRDVRGSPQVTPDETGWRVGGNKAWLHAFAAPQATCYVIDPTRSGQPAEDLLGPDWDGRMVHDGWSVYDRFAQAVHQQCNAHLIKRCNELLETATPGPARFPRAVKELLQRGLRLRDRFAADKLSVHGLRVMAGRLTNELLCLVGRRKTNPANERLAQFLFAHHDAIFNYLRHPGLDATNWRGEQAIRPAVVNRKVWGGNRTWTGAATQAALMSVMQTCLQRSLSPVRFLMQALTSPTTNLLIPAAGR